MRLSFYGNTNVGRQRDHNEDSFLILCDIDNKWQEVNNLEIDISRSRGIVFVVADGMGGANAGEVASDIAVKTVKERMTTKISSLPMEAAEIQKILNSIVIEGHNKIVKASQRNKGMKGMGTTIVMGFVFRDTVYVMWSGDSRCYVYNKNFNKELFPFTDDHSLVWERVKNKEIDPEEARLSEESNLILQSLGGALQKPEPDFKWIRLNNNDRILFCSDGLNSMLSNIGIQQILDFKSSPKDTCESLIQAAYNAGGRDNITVIVIDVLNNGEIITEPGSHEKVKRKKSKILPVLIILALIVIFGIIFRSEIAKVIISLFVRDIPSGFVHSTFEGDTNESDIQKPGIKSVANIGLVKSDTNNKSYTSNKSVNSTKDTLSLDNNRMILDSGYIETQLREAAIKIISIKNNIRMVEPGGAIYNSSFYDEYKVKLDSILVTLANQEKLLRSAANLNSNNLFIKITDFVKANEMHKEIWDTLTELEKRTNEIINR
jgi:serine/threonine protein phosphatase PrpC